MKRVKVNFNFKSMALVLFALVLSSNVWGETYTNVEVSFTTSTKPTGWNTNGTFNSSYYKMTSSQYVETSSITAIIPSNEVLDSDFKVNVACGTFGTWSGAKSVKVTASLLDANGTTLSSGSQTYSSLNSTQTTYRGDITIAKPSDVSKIAKLKIVFSNFTTGNDLRFAKLKLNYTTKSSTPAVVRTVAWKVNNETYTAGNPTTQVNDGEAVTTLPTAPTIDCGGKTFVGWTATANYTHATTAPGDLFSTAASAPVVSGGDVTYHAVFAEVSGGGTSNETLSCPAGTISDNTMTFNSTNFTFVHAKGSASSFASYSPWRLYVDNTLTISGSYTITKIEMVTNSTNYGAWNSTAGTVTLATSSGGTSKVEGINAKSVTFTFTTQARWSSITVYYDGTSYSNYTTTCAACTKKITITKGTPSNGSFTLTGAGSNICADEPVTVTLSNITANEHYHATAVTTSAASGGGTPSAISSGSATVSGITASTTINVTFAADTKYTIEFQDNIQSEEVASKEVYGGATFTFPVLTDKTATTEGTCEEVHYHFMGWVISTHTGEIEAGDIKTGTSDAVSAKATYKAVWAAEQE